MMTKINKFNTVLIFCLGAAIGVFSKELMTPKSSNVITEPQEYQGFRVGDTVVRHKDQGFPKKLTTIVDFCYIKDVPYGAKLEFYRYSWFSKTINYIFSKDKCYLFDEISKVSNNEEKLIVDYITNHSYDLEYDKYLELVKTNNIK